LVEVSGYSWITNQPLRMGAEAGCVGKGFAGVILRISRVMTIWLAC
jgi:hypothetical protein